jgi:hypothetical protein
VTITITITIANTVTCVVLPSFLLKLNVSPLHPIKVRQPREAAAKAPKTATRFAEDTCTFIEASAPHRHHHHHHSKAVSSTVTTAAAQALALEAPAPG